MSSQIEEQARKYLNSEDTEAGSELLRSGTKMILPLVKALAETLNSFNRLSWGKSDIQRMLDEIPDGGDEGFRAGIREVLTEAINQTPNEKEGGISLAQTFASREVINRAWQLVSGIGDAGIQMLAQIMQKENKLLRCTAALILCNEKPISLSVAKSFLNMRTFIYNLEDEPTGDLLILSLAIAGDRPSGKMIKVTCDENNCTPDNLYELLTAYSINFVAKYRN